MSGGWEESGGSRKSSYWSQQHRRPAFWNMFVPATKVLQRFRRGACDRGALPGEHWRLVSPRNRRLLLQQHVFASLERDRHRTQLNAEIRRTQFIEVDTAEARSATGENDGDQHQSSHAPPEGVPDRKPRCHPGVRLLVLPRPRRHHKNFVSSDIRHLTSYLFASGESYFLLLTLALAAIRPIRPVPNSIHVEGSGIA